MRHCKEGLWGGMQTLVYSPLWRVWKAHPVECFVQMRKLRTDDLQK